MSLISVLKLDAATYQRHALHAEDRAWVEKNCYIDIWIEVANALGLDPLPMASCFLGLDFEDDQWTFFKPPHGELWELYGVDVQELNVWRPILDQAVTHLGAGKLISTEADAFWLPDTRGTDYRNQHTKTTIVIESIDVEEQRLGYFHNASYYALQGEDFQKLFRVGVPHDPTFMPLFAEFIRIDRVKRRSQGELCELARGHIRHHLTRVPAKNPVAVFAERFPAELVKLQALGLPHYHAWAFATVRQLGASFEMLGLFARWLEEAGETGLGDAMAGCEVVSSSAKAMILKGARAVASKRPGDFGPAFAEMAAAWEKTIGAFVARYGR